MKYINNKIDLRKLLEYVIIMNYTQYIQNIKHNTLMYKLNNVFKNSLNNTEIYKRNMYKSLK